MRASSYNCTQMICINSWHDFQAFTKDRVSFQISLSIDRIYEFNFGFRVIFIHNRHPRQWITLGMHTFIMNDKLKRKTKCFLEKIFSDNLFFVACGFAVLESKRFSHTLQCLYHSKVLGLFWGK